MLNNLNSEIARYGIKKREMAKQLGCTEKTLHNKIKGQSKFSIEEAFLLKQVFFQKLDVDYLFANDQCSNLHKAT